VDRGGGDDRALDVGMVECAVDGGELKGMVFSIFMTGILLRKGIRNQKYDLLPLQ
jgi:hypothetical protein